MRAHSAPDDQVIAFKAWFTGILVGGLFLVFFLGQINLLLGLEKTRKVEVVKRTAHSKSFSFVMKSDSGKQYKYSVNNVGRKFFNPAEGAEITIITDGLLWSRVVAADTGKGMVSLP